MLGSALYFPHIDIRDPVWLRSTLLFWDDIQTIAPTQIQEPYLNDDTIICHEAGLLQPLRCDMYPELIEEIGRQVIRTADSRSSVSRAIRQVDQRPSLTISAARLAEHISNDVSEAIEELTGMHPQRVMPEIRELAVRYSLARMHAGKMPAHLREAFRGLELARMHPEKLPYVLRDLMSQDYLHDDEGDWVLVDNRFASAYMAALASKLAQQLSLSPLTPENEAHGHSFRYMFDDVLDGTNNRVPGTLMNITLRGIQVDASVPIERVIKFKERRKDQYLEFRSQIDELASTLQTSNESSPEEIMAKSTDIYKRKVERGLRNFKRELEQNAINAIWEGAFTAATVSASSTTALAYFSGLSGPALLGAAASVSALSIGVKNYLAGRKLRISSPYSYLYDVRANFGLPDFT